MSLADDLWAEVLGAPHALAQAGQQAWQTASAVPHNLAALVTHPQNYLAQLLQKANTQAGNSLRLLDMAGDPRLPPAVRREAQLAVGASALNFSPGAMGVIKAPGGNWLEGSIPGKLSYLKKYTVGENAWHGRYIKAHGIDPGDKELLDFVEKKGGPEAQAFLNKPEVRVNQWVDKQLTNYVRNDMGTERDPIRALAEKGILHYDPAEYGYDRPMLLPGVLTKRETWGFPPEGVGVSPLAKQWEKAADFAARPQHAGVLKRDYDISAQNPWMAKLDDNTPVYDLANFSHEALGFKHLTDELQNATRPGSDLPPELRLRPEQLKNVSVPQAVQLVSKINKWRADQATKANLALANNPATQVLKKYDTIPGTQTPNARGLHWVELKVPTDRTGELTAEDKAALNQRGALTPEKQAAINAALAKMPSKTALEDALKYEGDQMGHCVGGYCDNVKAGRNRIFSLRDSKGQPHVTVEVQPAKDNVIDDKRLKRAGLYRPANDYLFGDKSLDDLKNAIKKKA